MTEGLVAKPVQGVKQVWSGQVRTCVLPSQRLNLPMRETKMTFAAAGCFHIKVHDRLRGALLMQNVNFQLREILGAWHG